MNPVSMLWQRRDMLLNLTLRELKSRYKNSVLGFLWSILTPLFMAVIYVFFSACSRADSAGKHHFGVFAWQFTAQAVHEDSARSRPTQSGEESVLPAPILPTAITLASGDYLLSLIVQFILLAALLAWHGEARPGRRCWFARGAVSPLFLLALATCFGGQRLFPHAQHLVGVLLSAWFFASRQC
jgi:ABC-type polysaccharide/polyol phosphate export permease